MKILNNDNISVPDFSFCLGLQYGSEKHLHWFFFNIFIFSPFHESEEVTKGIRKYFKLDDNEIYHSKIGGMQLKHLEENVHL